MFLCVSVNVTLYIAFDQCVPAQEASTEDVRSQQTVLLNSGSSRNIKVNAWEYSLYLLYSCTDHVYVCISTCMRYYD